MMYKERIKELDLFSMVKRRQRDTNSMLNGSCRDGGTKLFLLVANDVNLPKLVTEKFQSERVNIGKKLVYREGSSGMK